MPDPNAAKCFAGRGGTYEGRQEDVLGAWHLVHLDGDSSRDVAVRCDGVEAARDV